MLDYMITITAPSLSLFIDFKFLCDNAKEVNILIQYWCKVGDCDIDSCVF